MLHKSLALHSMRIMRIRFVARIERLNFQRGSYYYYHHLHRDRHRTMPSHTSSRCLAERVRAATLDGSGQEALALRPFMPDKWMMEQALSEVSAIVIVSCCLSRCLVWKSQ
jgi:hypothetical protein